MLLLRNFAMFEQIAHLILRKLRKYAQNLLRVMWNNAEYCAKVVLLHAQMMCKSSHIFCLREIAQILRKIIPRKP